MEKNVVHLGLDVDDSAFHGCAFLKKSWVLSAPAVEQKVAQQA